MCSQAHFSSIVGFRVISIKDLSHLSLSLFASLLHGAGRSLSYFIFVFFFQLCTRANWRHWIQHTERDRQFYYSGDPCVVNNNIIRRQIATCCMDKQDASTPSKRMVGNGDSRKQISQANKQTLLHCSVAVTQLQSQTLYFFLFSTCSLFFLSLLCYSRDVVGSQ